MHYRAYCFDKDQHILAAADLDAVDDAEAVAKARQQFDAESRGHSLQVWQAKRRVHQERLRRPLTLES